MSTINVKIKPQINQGLQMKQKCTFYGCSQMAGLSEKAMKISFGVLAAKRSRSY